MVVGQLLQPVEEPVLLCEQIGDLLAGRVEQSSVSVEVGGRGPGVASRWFVAGGGCIQ